MIHQNMPPKLTAGIGILFATLFWALNAVIARGVVSEIPPLALSFWRWVLVLVMLLPISWHHLRRDWAEIKRNWVWLMMLGVLSVSAYNSLMYLAVQSTTAVNVSLLNTLIPVATIIMAWLLLGYRPGSSQLGGLMLAVLGMLIIVTRGEPSALLNLEFNSGDLIMIVAVTAWSIYTVMLKKRAITLHLLSSLTAMVALGLPWILPFYLWELGVKDGFDISIANALVLLYIALFASIFAFLLWNHGVAVLGPNRSVMFLYAMPVFAAIMGTIFLDEPVSWYHYCGGLLILAGLYRATLAPQRVAGAL